MKKITILEGERGLKTYPNGEVVITVNKKNWVGLLAKVLSAVHPVEYDEWETDEVMDEIEEEK